MNQNHETYNNLAKTWECSDVSLTKALREWVRDVVTGNEEVSPEIQKMLSGTRNDANTIVAASFDSEKDTCDIDTENL